MAAEIYTIASGSVRCALSPLGASIASVQVKDAAGRFIDVALAPMCLFDGSPDSFTAGRTIGPCCGRVREGKISLNAIPCQLSLNNGQNHIHGGWCGLSNQIWSALQRSPACVCFQLELPNGLEGYPGNRTLRAEYAVDGSTLSVTYAATTDRITWLDMTNHVYWDLSGHFDGSALDQRLEIAATQVVFNGEGHLPERIVPVDGPFDFTRPTSLAANMALCPEHEQLILGRGYNNAFVLDESDFAAQLFSPASGIRMTLSTDQPSIVLYSGGFLNSKNRLRSGVASPGCAVALEAQGLPDPFHLPGAVPELLRPGQEYRKFIRWTFEAM